MKNLKLLKIGGSIITEKEKEEPSPNERGMRRIAKEIKEGLSSSDKLILIHGAGSYGHPIVKRTEIHKGLETDEDKLNFAETQRLQNELNSVFTKKLVERKIPAFPVQASASAVMNGNLKEMNVEVIEGLVGMNAVPVLYGVPAYNGSKGCSILSGDEIMPYLAKELGAGHVLHGTNVDGIYTADPRENADAELIKEIKSLGEVKKYLGESKDTDVTGGMLNKVQKIIESGVSGRIFNASKPDNVKKALKDENIGTSIKIK